MEEQLTEINIERTHRARKPKQSKKKPRPIIIKFVRYNCRQILKLEKSLKKTGASITESFTAKCMEMFNKAKKRFGHRNAWTLDGQIYYLAEVSTKPQNL